MMKPEIAREHLGKLRSEKHTKARLERVRKLPRPLATIGLGLFGIVPDSEKTALDYDLRHRLQTSSFAKLHANPKGRAKIFTALYPSLNEAMEAGWQILGTLPYTVGYTRRGFRAPKRSGLYLQKRQYTFESIHNQISSIPDETLNPTWVASWACHLGYNADALGYLLAGVINAGGTTGDEVFTILKDSAANRHEIGGPDGHATRGLLCCSRPDAWDFMEKLLLAAQRQEGLRQSILEVVDEAHPEAFRRMLALVLDHNLIRFASVARAAGVWLGWNEEVENPKKLKADLLSCQSLLSDPAARNKAIEKGDPQTAYLALWAIATIDAELALKTALPLLSDKKPERRFLAAKLAWDTGLPEAAKPMLQLLDDSDMRLVAVGISYFRGCSSTDDEEDMDDTEITARHPKDLFERIEKLILKLPAKAKDSVVTLEGWPVPSVRQELAADLLLSCLQKRKPERLLPYMRLMGQYSRVRALSLLCEARTISSEVRELLLAFAGETNHYIRESALTHLKKLKISEEEVQKLEGYLTRKTADFRRAVYELLLTRPDKLMMGTVDRLLLASDANSRGAGIELARRLVDANRSVGPVRKRLVEYKEVKGKRLPTAEADAIEIILSPAARPQSLENGLGTFNPAERCPVVAPVKKKVMFYSSAAVSILKSLDELIHTHRATTYVDTRNANQQFEQVLGSITYRWAFPAPNDKLDAATDRSNLPLVELWEKWWQDRPRALRDTDGLELIRAIHQPTVQARDGEQNIEDDDDDDDETSAKDKTKPSAAKLAYQAIQKQLAAPSVVKLRYEGLIEALLPWLLKLYPPAGASDFLLDAAETELASVPVELIAILKPRKLDTDPPEEDSYTEDPDENLQNWREFSEFTTWLNAASARRKSADWTPAHSARLWQLYRLRDEPRPGVNRLRPEWSILLEAYPHGGPSLIDIYDHLIGPRSVSRYYWSRTFESLNHLTSIAPHQVPQDIREVVTKVVNRIIECELNRGETPIASSAAANEVQQVHGLSTLIQLLAGLGKTGFSKGVRYSASLNKPAVLTHLIKVTIPGEDETPEIFAQAVNAAVKDGLFPLERVVEFGLVNPRWVNHVARAIGWKGYEEAVYWLIAHTQSSWANQLGNVEHELDESDDVELVSEPKSLVKKETPWQAIVRARTNLTAEQRADGLIDVQWFHMAYHAVGNRKHWDAIEEAAKFLGYGQSHKKATRLADVLLGHTKRKDLVADIRTKFLKESVKLLGLLPLPTDPVKRESELADRYQVLKDYERYARGLSSLSKEPALQAARLGLENLAVTAGYGDPVRLEWAVTAREVEDVAAGKVSAKVGAITVALTLSPEGEADIVITQGGKTITKMPADARKNPKVVELIERKKQLLRTRSSTKRALEQAMCAGSRFTAAELKSLMKHPLVRPLLERLVLITPSGLGYPNSSGTSLKVPGCKAIPIKAVDTWAIAHALDLLATGDWPKWQADCFTTERVQPFKQVFREVYVPTAAEKEDGDCSRRYSGQQVNTTQANALFSTRGWSTREGIVKLFRDADLIAMVTFDHGYTTPADAAAPALRQLDFHRRGDWKAVPVTAIPPIIFSEVLRDLDLVVSVAHVGGVDPEATQSTIEMRASLLNTTFGFLKVKNVTIEGRHALIRGEYGQYSVHLGSGVVHKQPGGSLCVVPVNAQHRGRLFLPFADDDPRTAEVVSKVLLLARDKEIQDPTILEQIVNR